MKHLLLIAVTAFAFLQATTSQVYINEISSANLQGFVDDDNEYTDWMELYNSSSNSVDLSGYFLSDNKTNLTKWQFGNYVLQPNAFLVVFASGKDRQASQSLKWTTVIDHKSIWKYQIPTSSTGTAWHNLSFNDATWQEGPSGFGYGDGDDATILPNCLSVYIRKKFTIANVDDVKRMVLQMHYDDGFVAYINGVEIARANLGTPGVSVAYNATASDHEADFSNSLLHPETFEIVNPGSFLVQGTNVITIQGHNTSSSSSDLSLVPILTIGETPNGSANATSSYFSVPTSYYHTNFKLDQLTETAYLSTPDGVCVDSLKAMVPDPDISFGRQPDGTTGKFYFAIATPGTSNNNQVGTITPNKTDDVLFSVTGGYYAGGTTVSLSTPVVTDRIYYTTDGSLPSEQSTLYTTPLSITKNTVVKAKAYRDNTLPGNMTSNTYLTTNHKFMVTSLSTDPANLWDYNTGIYVKGPNAQSGNPYYGANFWQDWEKSAYLEIYDKNKTKVVSQGVGIKIYGAWTRANPQKSIAVFARKEYGKGSIEHKFFDDKHFDKFEALVLRNSGNDFYNTMFRDGFITGLARKMNLDRQGFKPSAHYLNGEYWGILNIREKINEHFLASNHSFDTEDLSILSNNNEIVMGTDADYKSMIAFIQGSSLVTEANYNEVLRRIDVDSYIQYQLMQIYSDNTDWPGNNIKYWRTHAAESQWRWILYDTDFGFGLYNANNFTHNTLAFATDATKTEWPNPAWSTLLFRRLLTSTAFRNNFINQYCDHLNTTFLPTNVNAQIDSLKSMYEGEIQLHLSKWNDNYNNWTNDVNVMKTFATSRPTYAWNHLQSKFALGSRTYISTEVNDISQGRIKLNSIIVDQKTFSGYYFQNIPIAMKALPKPGYKFVSWEGNVPSTQPTIGFNMATSGSFKANFAPAGASDVKVVINEINYKSALSFDTGDWVELYNNGAATVDLGGWELTDLGKEEGYIFPAGTILYPGEYIVVCEKLKKFRNNRPITRNSKGSFAFGLSSSGDKIRLYNTSGQIIDAVDFYATSPWPVIVNETGGTLELINPNTDNTKGSNWVVNNTYGTPGKQNLGYIATFVDKKEPTNDTYSMSCFPNPFKDFTTVEVIIPDSNQYRIEVIDLNGRLIKVLKDGDLSANTYYFDWNGTDGGNKTVSNGVYLIRCTSTTNTSTIKALKIK
jgi:hypothetical protein